MTCMSCDFSVQFFLLRFQISGSVYKKTFDAIPDGQLKFLRLRLDETEDNRHVLPIMQMLPATIVYLSGSTLYETLSC